MKAVNFIKIAVAIMMVILLEGNVGCQATSGNPQKAVVVVVDGEDTNKLASLIAEDLDVEIKNGMDAVGEADIAIISQKIKPTYARRSAL
ncbi:MAG: hypothetical protein QXI91_03790 [Candidatus Bathyarchaeia archaeon]